MKFKTEKIQGGLRFESDEGFCEIRFLNDQCAVFGCRTNIPPKPFGELVWALLHEIMPELGLKVLASEVPVGSLDEMVLIECGFRRDGIRRRMGPALTDLSLFSVTDDEVRYRVAEEPREQLLRPE